METPLFITMKNNVLFIVHRLYFEGKPKLGGIDRVIDYLDKKHSLTLIEHPFELINHPSTLTAEGIHLRHTAQLPIPFLWIEELIVNILWLHKLRRKYSLAVASDPLNFLSCYIAKKIGIDRKS